MRIGIFGGTFDPVHVGHLIIAEQAREQARLDQVWFVPSARPPHKLEKPVTPFERRVEMLQLAVVGQANFVVDDSEKERPGPSYTADTLAELQRLHPDNEFFLIMGSDCLPDFPSWHEPARIVERAVLVVSERPGFPMWTEARLASALGIADSGKVRLLPITIPLVDISSRDLRQRASEGRSLLYLVPRSIEVFIREKKLYM